MSYSTSTPPRMMLEGGIGGSPSVWIYSSADASATIDASGYITNGYDLGMRDGDLLLAYDTANKIWTAHTVLNTSSTTIDLGNGTTIGTATNSD